MLPSLTVVGSANLDLVAWVERLPRPGETVTDATLSRAPGGKGSNQAVAAARLGADVVFEGAVGDDEFAEQALEGLKEAGVEVQVGIRDSTGLALIAVDAEGENQIVVAPGANATLELDEADRSRIADAAVVLTNHEVPNEVVVVALTAAHQAGATAILNPAPARALPADVLRLGPILTPNEHELVVAIGNDATDAALDELVVRHAGPIVVTQGPAGALLAHGDRRERYPGRIPPGVTDTTGAGDTFNGVLAAWLASGAALEAAIEAANAAAALSVAAAGARGGMPIREAIETYLADG